MNFFGFSFGCGDVCWKDIFGAGSTYPAPSHRPLFFFSFCVFDFFYITPEALIDLNKALMIQ